MTTIREHLQATQHITHELEANAILTALGLAQTIETQVTTSPLATAAAPSSVELPATLPILPTETNLLLPLLGGTDTTES